MIIDPRFPAMPGRGTSGFPPTRQALKWERVLSPSIVALRLRPGVLRTCCAASPDASCAEEEEEEEEEEGRGFAFFSSRVRWGSLTTFLLNHNTPVCASSS